MRTISPPPPSPPSPSPPRGGARAEASPRRLFARKTPFNRNSLAALLAVLEAECGPRYASFRTTVVTSPEEIDGPGVVLFSFMTAAAEESARELTELRARLDAPLVAVAGGPHATGDPGGTLALGFDHVVPGEAGPGTADLIARLVDGDPDAPPILAPGERLDLGAHPPWPSTPPLFCAVEITRGCPLACAYCQVPALHGPRPRHRSVAALSAIFERAVATGHRLTRFVSPNAFAYGSSDGRTANPRALEALLETGRRAGLGQLYLGSFPSEVRPESVTPEVLSIVRALCGNRLVVVGLQSGSDAVLRHLRRGHTVAEGLRAVELIAARGLRPAVDFIFGLPGETDEDQAKTREVIRHITTTLGARVNTHLFAPLPGTPLQSALPSAVAPETRELVDYLAKVGGANLPMPSEDGAGPGCPRRAFH
jgi:B12-binding domain/radical SAM domain protein